MFSKDAAVLQGTIELLVLKRLSQGPMHGYGIASWIESATDDVLRVEEGSLYPALYRMTQKRWIKGDVGRVGEQSPREVLPPDPGRAAGIRAAGARLAAALAGREPRRDGRPGCRRREDQR